MKTINVSCDGGSIEIVSRIFDIDVNIPFENLTFNRIYDTGIQLPEEEFYQLHLLKQVAINGKQAWLLVYTKNLTMKCLWASNNITVKTMVDFKSVGLNAAINSEGLTVKWAGGLKNVFGLPVSDTSWGVDEIGTQPFNIPIKKSKVSDDDLKKREFQRDLFLSIKQLIHDDLAVTQRCVINMTVGGVKASFPISMVSDEITRTKDYYIPMSSVTVSGLVMYLRRSSLASLVIVRRPITKEETSWYFKLMESDVMSRKMFRAGAGKRAKGNVAVFYEKNASKAEEGTFELFLEALKVNPECYYETVKKSL